MKERTTTDGDLREPVATLQESLMLQSHEVVDSAGRIWLYCIDLGLDIPMDETFGVSTTGKTEQLLKRRDFCARISQL